MLSALADRDVPDRRREPERWGRWLENACIAHAWNAGQRLSYWRKEPYEVDMILSGSWGRCAVEIKSGGYTAGDLRGLMEFCNIHKDYHPLVVCDKEGTSIAGDAGIKAILWKDYLLHSLSAE
jgi:predicted AAA+ superfamily ATPase